ncbi:WbuC family cupin fold metalloprotein [Geotalea sp. SG265]|uniref:WbuC family cupin fold metalloprotein n=1 Tax=Geotalea sp. SG265 TaxID=2922867 RepID=UPI001FB00129
MKIIDKILLDDLTEQARANPRLRKNHNLHPSDDFCCHRLLNAIEPHSYIRPHRHLDPVKDESFVIVRGRLGILTFGDDGTVLQATVLSAESGAIIADIPHGVFHTAVSLEPGTIFFEAKAGPYRQLTEAEIAPWAPEDGTPRAENYLAELMARVQQ